MEATLFINHKTLVCFSWPFKKKSEHGLLMNGRWMRMGYEDEIYDG